jgi:hypothetical protein
MEEEYLDSTTTMEEEYLDSTINEGSGACTSRLATSTPKSSTTTVSNMTSASASSNMNTPPPAKKPLPKNVSAHRSSSQKPSWSTTNQPTLARNNRSYALRSTQSTQSQLHDSLQIQSETLEVLKSIDLSLKIISKRED